MFLQIEEIGDIRPAPAIDTLVIIAHYAHIAMLTGQRTHQLKLGRVGILIFINHHVTITRPALFKRLGMFLKKAQGQHQEIIKIHGVTGLKRGVVTAAQGLSHCQAILIAKYLPIRSGIFDSTQKRVQLTRISLHVLARDGSEYLFDYTQLL